MRKVFLTAIVGLGMLFAGHASAQISHGGTPALNHTKAMVEAVDHEMAPVDVEKYLAEDAIGAKKGSPLRVGVNQKRRIDLLADNNTTVVKDGAVTRYIASIFSPNALFSQLHFSNFELPEGSEIFFYDETGDFVLGSFNGGDVKEDGTFYTQAIPGSRIFVEYSVPANVNPGKLVVDNVIYGYKPIFGGINFDSPLAVEEKGAHGEAEGNCHINVKCPEGDDWRDQIRSVVAIQINATSGSYMCSGALINTTRQDRTPYVLSAFHCQEVDGNINNFVFYFLYQTLTCSATNGPSNKSVTGATIKAKSSYNGGSDFLLLLMNNEVPDSYTPYYAGWDRTSAVSPSLGCGIHHPGGDYKKISFPRLVNRGNGTRTRFFEVYWYTGSNNKGVTEQGSSGSPLFNAEKRIVGQLYAGTSACDYMQGSDLYGRVYSSWTGRGTDDTRLSNWLDPDGTGIEVLDGIDYNDVGIDNVSPAAMRPMTVYPNPSNGMVHFDINAIGAANYKVFDLNGRCMQEGRTVLTTTSQAVNLDRLPAGSYILQLHTASGNYSANVVIVK